ncbi:hypothetical protein V8E51_009610 [Hyaloscypha variabilis]
MGPAPPKPAPSGPVRSAVESKYLRALRATPLLLILILANFTFGTSLRLLEPQISLSGTELHLSSDLTVPFTTTYFHIPGLDDVISLFTAFFTPALGRFDVVGNLQAFALLSDMIPLLVIWMVEGERVGNKGMVASRFRTAFTLLAQVLGGAYLVPLYCFIHYVESGVQRYSTVETRRVEKLGLRTIFLTIGIAYIVPTMAMFNVSGLANKQWINGVFFQPFPLYAYVIQKVLQNLPKRSEEGAEKGAPEKDGELIGLVLAYMFSGAVVSGVYIVYWFFISTPIPEIFFSNLADPSAEHSMLYGAAKVLRYDQICMFSASAVWTLLHFWDLKRAGFVTAPWLRIVGIFAGTTLLCGPGAGIAVMWAWKEGVLRIDLPSGK